MNYDRFAKEALLSENNLLKLETDRVIRELITDSDIINELGEWRNSFSDSLNIMERHGSSGIGVARDNSIRAVQNAIRIRIKKDQALYEEYMQMHRRMLHRSLARERRRETWAKLAWYIGWLRVRASWIGF